MNSSPKINISRYCNSIVKRIFDITLSIFLLIIISPIILIIFFLVKFSSKGSIFFKQKRVGKNGKIFTILKFRTMLEGSEKARFKYIKLNEASGPVFKIKHDPRFTKIGFFLSRIGFDELPQLINVIVGDMSLIGPRPLPIYEYKKLKNKYKVRNLIKPGATSTWVVEGAHKLSFEKWMKLDKKYIEEANILLDFLTLIKTSFKIFTYITVLLIH